MTSPGPAPLAALPMVRLSRAFRFQHPWVFARLIEKPAERIPPGTVVQAVGPGGEFVGYGFYNGHARIGLRLLSTAKEASVDAAFFTARLKQAIRWRREQGLFNVTTGLRLINAEGDGLSGLVVDLFADILAVQFFAAGMFRQRDLIKSVLLSEFPGSQLYWFAEERVQKQESFDCWAMPAPTPTLIEEQGVRFHVAVGSKHKTGFFADQRDNRRLLAEHCRDKRVLDLCCHTGGFALYAKKGGAREVIAVDLDAAEALPVARANAEANGVTIDFQAADVYEWLRAAAARRDLFDVVILDPAKQTRSAEKVEAALQDYRLMNKLAMQVVAPGGILLTCSCSGLISEEAFLDSVRRAGLDCGREVQVFRLSGPGLDHPFQASVPEGRYLKAVWCRIL